jgi:hypothetical protein
MEAFQGRFYEVVQEFYGMTTTKKCKKVRVNSDNTPLVIGLDSVEALKPETSLQKMKAGKVNFKHHKRQVAEVARGWGPWYSETLLPLQKTYPNLTFIALNQERTNIKTSMFSNEPDRTTPGGRALKFYASLGLRLERRKLLTDATKNYRVYAVVTKMKVEKSSVGEPFRECFIYTHMKHGMDNARTVMWFLASHGVLKKQAGKATVYTCEHFKVDGPVAGVEFTKKQLDLSNAVKLLDTYGWEKLSDPIKMAWDEDDYE